MKKEEQIQKTWNKIILVEGPASKSVLQPKGNISDSCGFGISWLS